MKHAGMIGGLGPEATMNYYQGIITRYQDRQNSHTTLPELMINSVNMYHMFDLIDNKQFDETATYLANAANQLQRGGADFGFMCGLTPHVVFEQLQAKTTLPLISIIDTALQHAKRLGVHRLGLLGTKFTMQGTFFSQPFIDDGIEIVVPSPDQQTYVHDHLVTELENGIVLPETKRGLLQIIKTLVDQQHIDGLVLGCTELPLILSQQDFEFPVLDIAELHMDKITELILAD
ncbi:aspartate/glutamate racemase family protein [Secundilactobacillus similis]|uniref:Aspartate racemase n=1 Tax=Secundilactobacillus similis DSM 23365 = JCM 2765 TaxID=1423804 RepID=A0A0R2F4R2_9LACO|nr:amino acid racemase [Secundilactobacillus similis]KRN23246.1 aspartate racemase [Secundilactobacillus similis DSM 23365 = JCM 2765]